MILIYVETQLAPKYYKGLKRGGGGRTSFYKYIYIIAYVSY
jgi:hypothetical protein